VIVRHRNGLDSVYCHLSKVAVSSGKAVAQKQIVGYVGMTGLATGPHLHFAVKKNGTYVNPLSMKIPRDAPLPAKWKPDYLEKIAPLRARLDGEPVALN
jgi:murein DD-endopeptidase MepM/ murein hydrolase activator NlpD